MVKVAILLLGSACLITFSSCAFGDREDVVPAVTVEDQVIYVAGRYNQHACIWIVNGTVPFRIMLPELPATTSSWAKGIAVRGKEVIVTGSCFTGAFYYPMMWINGAPVLLTPAGHSSYSYNGDSILIHEEKIFVPLTSNNIASLWVSGALTALPLPAGAVTSKSGAVAVSEGHVIVGGTANIGAIDHACVWVDGQPLVLDSTANDSAVQSVAWIGRNWYAGGNSGMPLYATLWIDGAYSRADNVSNGFIHGMYVHEGLLYMGGRADGDAACLWLGAPGAKLLLWPGSSESSAVLVSSRGGIGETVLVTGRANDGPTAEAVLWINGMVLRLDSAGAGYDTEARAVALGSKP